MLLGGNALVAQVQGDLQTQLDTGGTAGDVEMDVDHGDPLRLNNLKLPSDLPFTLPPGTKLDPQDLSKLTIPEGLDVELPDGFDLSDLDFDLPTSFDLDLPEGSIFDPRTGNLSLPNGGAIRLPDGKRLDLPPGTNLTLPREVLDQLLDQGLPSGRLDRDMSFRLDDLPPGLNVGMDPPQLVGNGTLRLPPGTELRLPPGVEIPPEALLGLVPFLFPEGTEIVVPPDADGSWTLPKPSDDPRRRRANDTATPEDRGVPVVTDIDRITPERVRKGDPVTVEGYVRARDTGRDVAGAPVRIYMNETKAQPGVLVGAGATDAQGRFRITLDLPTDKPARQWQLVNHAAAFVAEDGTAYADGWGDPPIETYAATAWTIEAPARDGLQSATAIRGTLLDDTGAPVHLARVELVVDGVVVRQGATGIDGAWSTTHVFTTTGTHTVQMRFGGNAHYEPSQSDERTILIQEVAIDVPSAQRVERGETLTLAGRVLVSGVATPGKEVTVSTPFSNQQTLVTDSAGRFRLELRVPAVAPLGEHDVRYRVAEYGVSKTQRVDVWTTGRIVLDAPDRARVDAGVPVAARLVDDDGAPIAGQTIILTLAGPGGADEARVATAAAAARATLSPAEALGGVYTLRARLADERHVIAERVERPVELGLLEVAWDVPETVVRGKDVAIPATVTFGGTPLDGARAVVGLFASADATTDARGAASWRLRVPAEAPLGPATATLAIPEFAFTAQAPTRVVAVPKLTLSVPHDYVPGEDVAVNVTLVDDLGAPLGGHPIELSTRVGAWTWNDTVLTGADGTWVGALPTDAATRDTFAIAARHPETANVLPASESAAVAAAASAAGAPSIPPLAWGAPLALGLVGGAGLLARHRLKARHAAAAAAPAAPMAMLVHAPGFDIDLGIPDGEPLVWGVGEPLVATVTPTGATVGRGSVRLHGGGVDATVPLEPGRPQTVTLRFPDEGEVALTAARADDHLAAAVTIDLRIVDYRKEIAREFDLLLERARLVEETLDKQSTAQEVEWVLGHRLGAAATAPLGDMSLVMDVANYSQAPIARPEYLRFVRAMRALDPLLPPGGAAP